MLADEGLEGCPGLDITGPMTSLHPLLKLPDFLGCGPRSGLQGIDQQFERVTMGLGDGRPVGFFKLLIILLYVNFYVIILYLIHPRHDGGALFGISILHGGVVVLLLLCSIALLVCVVLDLCTQYSLPK
jgi:hypothetical protein